MNNFIFKSMLVSAFFITIAWAGEEDATELSAEEISFTAQRIE